MLDPLRLWSTGAKHDGRKVVLALSVIGGLAAYLMGTAL
jgi:hypothetical protein